jgi:hypothetical protein
MGESTYSLHHATFLWWSGAITDVGAEGKYSVRFFDGPNFIDLASRDKL